MITGLTASAGLAVIMIDAAAVFVDGRYILQAEAQVNGDMFERRHLIDEPPTDWIVDNLRKTPSWGTTLAFNAGAEPLCGSLQTSWRRPGSD